MGVKSAQRGIAVSFFASQFWGGPWKSLPDSEFKGVPKAHIQGVGDSGERFTENVEVRLELRGPP